MTDPPEPDKPPPRRALTVGVGCGGALCVLFGVPAAACFGLDRLGVDVPPWVWVAAEISLSMALTAAGVIAELSRGFGCIIALAVLLTAFVCVLAWCGVDVPRWVFWADVAGWMAILLLDVPAKRRKKRE